MTDKQMAEKKKEFFERFTESHDGGIEAGEYYLWKSNDSAGKVWQWIEKLVEEVEREKSEEIEELKHWLKRYEKDISNAIN